MTTGQMWGWVGFSKPGKAINEWIGRLRNRRLNVKHISSPPALSMYATAELVATLLRKELSDTVKPAPIACKIQTHPEIIISKMESHLPCVAVHTCLFL